MDEDEDEDEDKINEIKKEFENYKEDVEFGGTKKLIKIHIKQYLNIKNYILNFKYT